MKWPSIIGALWASGIGASLAYTRTTSPLKPSLRLIHARYIRTHHLFFFLLAYTSLGYTCPACFFFVYISSEFVHARSIEILKRACLNLLWIVGRMHAQALTLAVLSGAAVYHYYEKRTCTEQAANASPKWSDHRNPSVSVSDLWVCELGGPFFFFFGFLYF